jgi:hypothetical protein
VGVCQRVKRGCVKHSCYLHTRRRRVSSVLGGRCCLLLDGATHASHRQWKLGPAWAQLRHATAQLGPATAQLGLA